MFDVCVVEYLTALGARGTLKAAKESISKDELFVLEDSHPQLKLKSATGGKRVSVRTGIEVAANQDTVTDAELFQIEINKSTKQVSTGEQDTYDAISDVYCAICVF